MMSFGKFLLEKKIITQEEYIICLAEQLRKVPSTLEAMIDLNMFENSEVINIVHSSQEKKCDLYDLLDDKSKVEVDKYKIKVIKSIAEIVLNKGFVDKKKLVESISDFEEYCKESKVELSNSIEKIDKDRTEDSLISNAALESLKELQGGSFDMSEFSDDLQSEDVENEKVSTSPSKVDNCSSEVDTGIHISSAALESLKELGGVSEEEMNNLSEIANTTVNVREDNDYSLIFTSKKLKKLKKISKMILEAAEKKADISNYLNSLYREIHVVKGATTLVGATRSRVIIEIWESLIDLLFNLEN